MFPSHIKDCFKLNETSLVVGRLPYFMYVSYLCSLPCFWLFLVNNAASPRLILYKITVFTESAKTIQMKEGTTFKKVRKVAFIKANVRFKYGRVLEEFLLLLIHHIFQCISKLFSVNVQDFWFISRCREITRRITKCSKR